ncbi:MAG: hypothetical protein KJ052_02920 [Candidatus Hydrogenedentes bacterium]|nr:hypothetical protein [Candidatus Hydrogenedentota bacterium]
MEFLQSLWGQYPWIIDLCLYFFLFGAAARVAFAKIYPGHEGKALSIAVGLVLAAALTIAQRKLGFSLESMGPIAAVLLCVVVFIVAYRLLKHSDLPPWLTISFSLFFALGLLKVALPTFAQKLARENPGLVFLGLAAVAFWMWQSAAAGAQHIRRRQPGYALERFKLTPSETTLRKEERVVKNRMKNDTYEDIHKEKQIESNLTKALGILEREGLTPHARQRVQVLLDKSQESAGKLEAKCLALRQLDDALERFDLKWFRRMRNVNLGQLTQAQQDILKQNIIEDRRRLHVEEELKKLETGVAHHTRDTENHLASARQCVQSGNAAGTVGWINEAIKSEHQAKTLDEQILAWEKRLLKLVRRQKGELLAA